MPTTLHAKRTFLITDDRGDVTGSPERGLYHEDTRFLCEWRLLIDGRELQSLTTSAENDEGWHFLTNPSLSGIPQGVLGIVRRQVVGAGLHEDLTIENYAGIQLRLTVDFRFDADFAHVFEVKRALEEKPEGCRATDLHVEVSRRAAEVEIAYERAGTRRGATLSFSQAPSLLESSRASFDVTLARGGRWELCCDLRAKAAQASGILEPKRVHEGADADRARRGARAARYCEDCPSLESDDAGLVLAYERSLRDIASLRLRGEDASAGEYLIAAGIPWFMALFGRDTLITAYQTLPFFPDLARGSLLALARHQGKVVDKVSGEEPGKILHEYRTRDIAGARRLIPKFPYFGTLDATPLFAIVLHEYWRWTGDRALLESLRPPLLAALEWIDRYGDRDGDGYVEYLLETPTGLSNQGWKDSGDSVRFQDGRIAHGPIALCEVQGYAYDAKLRGAEMLAFLGDEPSATRLRSEAAALRERFNEDFWLPEGATFAEALDGTKRRVDSVTSNPGHLLWSGTADEDKAVKVAETLVGARMFSGWGIRTMAEGEAAYNPLSYHNGSVWPHENSLIAAGLARYGRFNEAARVIRGMLDAAAHYPDARLPELFAGYDRERFRVPVEYPTANRPQAWAAGSVLLFIRTLLGAVPDAPARRIEMRPILPGRVGRLIIRGVRVGDTRLGVSVRRDGTAVQAAVVDTPRDFATLIY